VSEIVAWILNHIPSLVAAVGAFIAASRAGAGITEARQAKDNTAPMSNGFARRMEEKVDLLASGMTSMRKDQQDIRVEMRDGIRDVRTDLSRHVGDHAQAGMRKETP
jgi:hypothetical protein